MKNEKGFTLIEALIVITLIGIIVAISVPLTLRLIRQYRVESQTRTIYATWAETRQRAMQRNIPHLIGVKSGAITVYEDFDKDGEVDTGEKVRSLSLESMTFPVRGKVGNATINASSEILVEASEKGLFQPDVFLTITDDLNTYNCVRTSVTRLGLGKNPTGDVNNANSCELK